MDTNEQKIEKLEKRVASLEAICASGTQVANPNSKGISNISVFLSKKKLDDDVKRTLAIAYWLEYFEKKESFNAGDIGKLFRSARYTIPKNINDKINMNVKNRHFAALKNKKEGKKAWYITDMGSNLVENTLNK